MSDNEQQHRQQPNHKILNYNRNLSQPRTTEPLNNNSKFLNSKSNNNNKINNNDTMMVMTLPPMRLQQKYRQQPPRPPPPAATQNPTNFDTKFSPTQYYYHSPSSSPSIILPTSYQQKNQPNFQRVSYQQPNDPVMMKMMTVMMEQNSIKNHQNVNNQLYYVQNHQQLLYRKNPDGVDGGDKGRIYGVIGEHRAVGPERVIREKINNNKIESHKNNDKVQLRTHKSGLLNPPTTMMTTAGGGTRTSTTIENAFSGDKMDKIQSNRQYAATLPLNVYGTFPYKSPRRYIEGDVNIHYRTPIRHEFKELIPEHELAERQAEAMRRLYQEEKRRKYMNELQDMNNRRHTDNFTPSQKSPIALNRYDSFQADAPNSPVMQTRQVCRALYNFQGQTARELSFKKGELIYVRRQIDKNWFEGEHNAAVGLFPANYVEIITKDTQRLIPAKKPAEGQARAKFNFTAASAIELSLNKGEVVTLTRRVDDNWFEGKIANRKGIFPVSYVEVLVDIGVDHSVKPVGAPAAHSLIIQPTFESSRDVYASTNGTSAPTPTGLTNGGSQRLLANGSNDTVRETTTEKTEVLHVDTNSEPIAFRALYKYTPQNNDELELQEGDIVYVLEKCDDGWYCGTSQRTGYFGTFPGNYVELL